MCCSCHIVVKGVASACTKNNMLCSRATLHYIVHDQCSQQNLPSKVLPFVMSSLASLTCPATPGRTAARKSMLIAGFPGSSNKVEGVLPRFLPGGRTFCQGL